MPSYILRKAVLKDIDLIAELEEASFPIGESASKATIEYRLLHAGKYFFTFKSEERNEIVGFINGTCTNHPAIVHETMSLHDPAGRNLVVHSVTVNSIYRRNGVGTSMVKSFVKEMIADKSISTILLLTKPYLLPFYLGCGFHLVGLSNVIHGLVRKSS